MRRTLEITIDQREVDKRQTLARRIDMALMLGGARVTAGEYVVTIERKTTRTGR